MSKIRQEPELFEEKIGKLFAEDYYEDRTISNAKNGLRAPSAQVFWNYPKDHPAPALPIAPGRPPRTPSPPNIFDQKEVQSDKEPLFVEDPALAEQFGDLSDAILIFNEPEEPLLTIQVHNNDKEQIESPRSEKSKIPNRDANWSRGPDSLRPSALQ